MFNLFHHLAAKLAAVIGGIFITVGSSISPTQPPVPPSNTVSTTTAEVSTSTPTQPTSEKEVKSRPSSVTSVNPVSTAVAAQQVSQEEASALKAEQLKAAQAAADAKNAAEAARNKAEHAAQLAQSYLDKLKAINQQVVTLNSTYLSDVAAIEKNPTGMFGDGVNHAVNARKAKYDSAYQALVIQYQQIVVDSNNCGSACPQILLQVNH